MSDTDPGKVLAATRSTFTGLADERDRALDSLAAAEAEVERLREALKQIAEADYEYDDDYDVPAAIARAALETKP